MKSVHQAKYIETLTKEFGWTDFFAKEFLLEYRNCGSFYKGFEYACKSFYPDSVELPNENPFKKGT